MVLKAKYKKLNDACIKDNLISKDETASGILTMMAVNNLWGKNTKVTIKSLKEEIGIDVSKEFKNLKKGGYFDLKKRKILLDYLPKDKNFGIGLALLECVALGFVER